MRYKLAILHVLANRPSGRATLDEVRREAELTIASLNHIELKRFATLGDLDIFRSRLVLRDEEGLQITDAGRSLLQSLESPSGFSPDVSFATASQPLRLIDDVIGREELLRIFNLEITTLESGADEDSEHQGEEGNRSAIETADVNSEASAANLPAHVDPQNSNDDQLAPDGSNGTIAIGPPDAGSQKAPAFLQRSFGSKVQEPSRRSSRVSVLFAFIAKKRRFLFELWRRHSAQGVSNRKVEQLVQGVGGAAFAFLSLVVVVTCVAAAIALGQIKSLKSDIAMLHREISPLRERLERLEQAEKTKLDQQEGRQDVSGSEKSKAGATRTDQTGLNLSREEIQLIRDYIKAAPSVGMAAPAINVGDPIGGATIPLPSPLTEKVPKLIGASFTTRNGTIIISTKNSRRADAVLAPN